MACKVLTIANEKGGVAKTTTALSLAPLFAHDGKKVLMVDLDIQANLTRCISGKSRTEWEGKGIYELVFDMFKKAKDPKSFIVHTAYDNIDLIPGNLFSTKLPLRLAEYESVYGVSDYVFINDALTPLFDDYDMCIIDSPMERGVLMYSSLYMSDYILIPCKSDAWSFDGVVTTHSIHSDLMRENPDYYHGKIVGIVQTIVEKVVITDYTRLDLEKSYPEELLNTTIRKANIVNECTFQDEILTIASPNSNVAIDYKSLYQEMGERIKKIEKGE